MELGEEGSMEGGREKITAQLSIPARGGRIIFFLPVEGNFHTPLWLAGGTVDGEVSPRKHLPSSPPTARSTEPQTQAISPAQAAFSH